MTIIFRRPNKNEILHHIPPTPEQEDFIQKPAVYFGSPGGELSAQRTEGWLPTQGLRQHRTIPALRLKHRFGT